VVSVRKLFLTAPPSILPVRSSLGLRWLASFVTLRVVFLSSYLQLLLVLGGRCTHKRVQQWRGFNLGLDLILLGTSKQLHLSTALMQEAKYRHRSSTIQSCLRVSVLGIRGSGMEKSCHGTRSFHTPPGQRREDCHLRYSPLVQLVRPRLVQRRKDRSSSGEVGERE